MKNKILLYSLLSLSPFLPACSSPNGKTAAAAQAASSTPPDSAAQTQQSAAQQDSAGKQFVLPQADAPTTTPPYGLEKVLALVKNIREVDDSTSDGQISALSDSSYSSLTLDEKFTYNMINLEVYSQMCDILPERKDESARIYGELPNFSGEQDWSERQVAFFKNNRDSVQQLIKTLLDNNGEIGMNVLSVVVMINAKEMIPYLINLTHRSNNHYILTVLLLLMENNKFPEFMQSSSRHKLYDNNEKTYSAYLTYSKANEDLIIQRATHFYNGSPQQ
jgi:hypothetical protein